MKKNFAVIGGTGKTGRRVVERLMKRGENVRSLSRSTNPAFDWNNPQSYKAALEGVDTVYIVYHPDLAVPGAYESIVKLTEVAKAVGVKKLVLLSGKGEKEAERCEEVVAASGLDYVIVRAAWFNQNFSESFFLDPIKSGVVALPMFDIKIPFVDANDIADVVTEALLREDLNGKTLEVTGPSLLTLEEAVQAIAEVSKRSIQFIPVSLDQYLVHMKKANIPADVIWLFEYLFSTVLTNPDNQLISHDIVSVLGRSAVTFEDYAKETAKTGVWAA
ncbi:MAG: NAD(P)H-binding protein [Balneolaceae bacterium]|nr:NAD(P)H-binding protein [Balneolaceae bacterium]